MWYVNLNSKITKELTSACFILTMWYVNKGGRPPGINLFFGFILTMWYVNVKQVIVTLALLAAFYINYVA